MTSAIKSELDLQKKYLSDPIDTIYFGGGTPSIMDSQSLNEILNSINRNFDVIKDAEITLEANPDDLSAVKLDELSKVGFNRLSVGIQSFDDTVLQFLNRSHDSVAGLDSMRRARQAGFQNISVDLIYAIPGQNLDQWKRNIEMALTFGPEHISAYSLTIEEKTVFGNWSAKGKLIPAGEDVSAEQFEALVRILEDAGYIHYEISNFSLPGFHSRHNSNYWKQIPYLGVGPSAHSYDLESRQFNVNNNHEYVRSLKSGVIPFTLEKLSNKDKVNDYLLTTLRTCWGTDLQKLRNELGLDLLAVHGDYIKDLVNHGLAVIENEHLILTKKGKFLADKISSDMFLTGQT